MADLGSTTHETLNASGRSGGGREVDTDIHSRIGSQLKALYNDVVEQPVPDRFAELLRRLETQSASESAQESN
ncbi:NepR family anti-sigma factor [Breoghania sp. L-A4]|uniref:NepR family anti-sigma factor n=1 Tax=Breoghania sp. L-A4 TaxID=2304600 RepID=UPI000E35FB99|nr:NepR family anti-sigma factor [Breoghania sp. L-A4]AXS40206.1 hypothetical protein D1F64_09230 [Breoghania sp. L-A4]